jgi:hypothetical protein
VCIAGSPLSLISSYKTDEPLRRTGGDGNSGWMSSWDALLSRLLVHSALVHFAVGVALFSAGVLQLVFAATGPPPRVQPEQQARAPAPAAGKQTLADPLLGGENTPTGALSGDEADVEKGPDGSRHTPSTTSQADGGASPQQTGQEGGGVSEVVQRTSWPPAWARSL